MIAPNDAHAGLVRLLGRLGIRDRAVLRAMAEVPREEFLPPELREFAYEDTPLPIGEGQTISQPFIVALMAEAAEIGPADRVLEVGTGSGYAAAVLGRLAGEVYTVERHETLAEQARERLAEGGFANVHVLHGDGTLGWAEHAPFDAILVAAGGPEVPKALLSQLAPGGRCVIPVGPSGEQRLVRVVRADGRFESTDLGAVRFVPLIGAEGWEGEAAAVATPRSAGAGGDHATARLIREAAEPIGDIDAVDLGSLTERIGDAKVVLIGEATHGTSEFYRMRARITRELIERHGFGIVAIEGDWPDAARVHRWVRHQPPGDGFVPFDRFPTWMWRNRETEAFVGWLREWNGTRAPEERVGFHGLDLYSMHRSADAVLRYLDRVDPAAARAARERYGCLTPWQRDPSAYGRAAISRGYRLCEAEVVTQLRDLLGRSLEYMRRDGEAYLDAVQNAQLVTDAERYYRVMYEGGRASWNLRDRHMFETLINLLAWRGRGAKAVVWAHNSHVGSAHATEMGWQGEINIGSLCRDRFGAEAYLIGLGTDHGTVAAATEWDGPMEIKRVRPALAGSYEALAHAAERAAFLLHLREPVRPEVADDLRDPRLERAIGVIYRPETERQSHYFESVLPEQFDSWIWFDETRAVAPIPLAEAGGAYGS